MSFQERYDPSRASNAKKSYKILKLEQENETLLSFMEKVTNKPNQEDQNAQKIRISIDTREQLPLSFDSNVEVKSASLPTFDYALENDESHFAIERKGLDDFISSIAIKKNWENELRKIQRAKNAGFHQIYYVIEATFEDLSAYPYDDIFLSKRVHKDFILHRWRELEYEHGVHIIFANHRWGAANAISLLLKSRQEEIMETKDVFEEHAKYSPSSLRDKEKCPWYEKDPAADMTAANKGTKLHKAVETNDTEGLTDDEIVAVTACQEYVTDLITSTSKIFREIKIDVDGLTWGTADLIIYDEDKQHVEVIDYKFGRGAIEDAEINVQGWAYTLGAMRKFGAKTARLTFIMPFQGSVSDHIFTEADMPRMHNRIQMIIEKAEKKKTEDLRMDPKLCRRCGNAGFCPRLAKESTKLLEASDENRLPVNLSPETLENPNLIAKILNIIPAIEQWIKKAQEIARAKAQEGVKIPGYTVMKRKGSRSILDPIEVTKVLIDFFPEIPKGEIDKIRNIRITDLEEITKKYGIKNKVDKKLDEMKLLVHAKDSFVLKCDETQKLKQNNTEDKLLCSDN